MVGIAAVTSAFGVIQTWISTKVGQQVMHGLRTSVFAHLQRQSIAFFTRTRTGEVQSRITNDVGGMESVVTSTATSIAANLTTAVATAVAMVALSWKLSLISLVVMPPSIYLSRKVARMRRAITTQQQRELADLNVTIEEGLSINGVQLAKTMGTGPSLVERFTASSARLIDLELRSQLAGRWRMASMSIIFAAVPAVIYLAAGLPVTAGAMTIGTLVAFTTLQNSLFRPLTGLLSTGVSVVSSLALFARIFEYLDLPVEVDDPAHPVEIVPEVMTGHVRLSGVSFTYPGADRPALTGIDLDVPAGTTLALVGETGSGKTTLAALIARLYDPAQRRGEHRRDRRPRHEAHRSRRGRGRGQPGDLPAAHHGAGEPALRQARRDRRGDRGRGPGRPDPRPDRRAARRLRHHGRLPRPPLLRRREAAAGHRPDPAARSARARAGRGDQRPGHRDRAGRPARVRPPRRRAAPRSPSRTGSPPCATRTRSWCWTTGT